MHPMQRKDCDWTLLRAGNQFVLREEDGLLAAPMYIANASHQVRLSCASVNLKTGLPVQCNVFSAAVNYNFRC